MLQSSIGPHAAPHAPQWLPCRSTFRHWKSPGASSQQASRVRHAVSPPHVHVPPVHPSKRGGQAVGKRSLQLWLHAPQCSMALSVSVSQPGAALQSSKPVSQTHTEPTQVSFAALQERTVLNDGRVCRLKAHGPASGAGPWDLHKSSGCSQDARLSAAQQ